MYVRLLLWLLAVTAYSVIVISVFEEYHVPESTLGDAITTVLGLAIGVLLVFRNRASYDRWWEARTLWGCLINESRNLAIKTAAFADIELAEQRHFADLLIAFPNALRMHLRGERDPLPEIEAVYPEIKQIQHRPGFVVLQIFKYLDRWNRDDTLHASIRIIERNANTLMEICGACERIRNTPMVPSYRYMAWGSVILYTLAGPWVVGVDQGWFTIPVVLLASCFMLGMEMVAEAIEEPFGKEKDDLPLDSYCETIERFIRETLPAPAATAEAVAG